MHYKLWMENNLVMPVTHEEARSLIHLDLDGGLRTSQKQMLDSHLAVCSECQRYANSMRKMETGLRPLLQRQWNRQPDPLSMSVIDSSVKFKISDGMILATRIAAVGVMFIVFMFSAWQFTFARLSEPRPVLASVPPIPIPSTSTQFVGTVTQTQSCEELRYIVEKKDTLASITDKFSITREELLTANSLKTEDLFSGMKLIIPLCNFTPTINALTITYTPISRPILSTPDD
jgi:LysM repeat protein